MSEPDRSGYKAQFNAIQPEVDEAYNRHISRVSAGRTTISLDPYSLVPIENYEALKAEYEAHVAHWANSGVDIRPVVKDTLKVDAATEENLPWYTARIDEGFQSWIEWNGRWTAEERSHGETMVRDIEARGIMDMSTEWLPTREQNMATGIHPKIESPADGLAYVATQELLTQIAHFQSARLMDVSGSKTLRALGGDERRHYQFYVSAFKALARVNPDMALMGMQRQHEGDNFAMPGQKGIPGYSALARTIALSGVFDAVTVLEAQKQTIDEAGLLEVKPMTDAGKEAQEWANAISSGDDPSWARKKRLMELLRERAARPNGSEILRPFILGYSVELKGNSFEPIDG